jgi:hypothetical protein
MSWDAGSDEAGVDVFRAFLVDGFGAGFAVLLAGAGIGMPGLLP